MRNMKRASGRSSGRSAAEAKRLIKRDQKRRTAVDDFSREKPAKQPQNCI